MLLTDIIKTENGTIADVVRFDCLFVI
jgi:hypothetical protein